MVTKIKQNYLIIIPARKGSSGIKNKNLIKFNGKQLILHSIIHALKIKNKKKIICISTNSNEIIKLCKKYKNIDIIKRPSKYSQAKSRDIEFVNHCLAQYSKKNILFMNVLILRPTNPIRNLPTIKKAMKIFEKDKEATSLKTLFITKKTPFKTWIFTKKKYIKNNTNLKIKDFFNAPRQILPTAYDQTGTLEIIKINYRKKIRNFSGNKILGFVIDKKQALDIDDYSDINLFLKK